MAAWPARRLSSSIARVCGRSLLGSTWGLPSFGKHFGNRHADFLCNFAEQIDEEPVMAEFVFLQLLKGHAEALAEGLLGHALRQAFRADDGAEGAVERADSGFSHRTPWRSLAVGSRFGYPTGAVGRDAISAAAIVFMPAP